MAAIHPLSLVQDPPAASPVRVLLARYQQMLDRVEESGAVMWAPLGRRRFTRWLKTPAPRSAVVLLASVHVRGRLRVLERRNHARIALLKESAQASRDLDTLTHFSTSLRRTPGAKLVAPAVLAGVLLASFVLANFIVPMPQAHFLGDLTKATLTFDRGEMVDAVTKSHLDAESLIGALILMLWATALVTLPLVPAAGVVRRVVAEQPGLPQAESAGFAALRARRPHQLELGLFAEACLAGAMLCTGAAGMLEVPADGGFTGGLAIFAYAVLLLAGLTLAGIHRRLNGRRQNWLMRIARWLVLFQISVLALFALVYLIAPV
jgi:hypothetical protein